MEFAMTFQGYTDDEIKRWLWLRAIEWDAFPAYLSQPIAPILSFLSLVFRHVRSLRVRTHLVRIRSDWSDVGLAGAVVIPVVLLKWPAAIGSSVYLFVHNRPTAGVVALIWPLVASFTGVPGKIGVIELVFAKKIGFVSPDAEQP